MGTLQVISLEGLFRLTPRIFGTIRWKRSIGGPSGDPCNGFDIRVEEHTATQYVDVGGGHYAPKPGTGIWKDVSDSLACRALSDQGDDHGISFQITGLHVNIFPDGYYKITPSLKGNWGPSGVLAVLGYLAIEPLNASVAITEERHIQTVEFEVVRRSWFSGRRLG